MSISREALCFLSLSKSSVSVLTMSVTMDLKLANSPCSFSKASFQELSTTTVGGEAAAAADAEGGGAAVVVLLEEEVSVAAAGGSWGAGDD